jgi:hypothetical protein
MAGEIHPLHMNFLLLMGSPFSVARWGQIFKLIRFPRSSLYVIGQLLVESGYGFSTGNVEMMRPFNFFTLGIIGFHDLRQLKLGVLRKYGRQFMIILLAE